MRQEERTTPTPKVEWELPRLGIALAVLAHDARRTILAVLARGAQQSAGLSISEVSAATELDRLTTSRHLKILRRAGLVSSTTHGRRVLNRLNPKPLLEIEDWLNDIVEASED